MADLTIYDSRGTPIRDEVGPQSDEIKDFFFDGVRFALGPRRAVCFFRARDNDTSRSEQYYAVYNYDTRSELKKVVDKVYQRVEDKYDMVIDSSHDDTRVFELLSDSENLSQPPGSSTDFDDISTLLSRHHQVKVGVGRYEDAYNLFGKFIRQNSVSRIAISDNADGNSVASFDLVIEKGAYTGLEPLGETATELESLREQRRSQWDPGYESDDGSDYLFGYSPSPIVGAILFGGVGALLILGTVYGSCFVLGTTLPLASDFPGIDNCGATFEGFSAEMNDSQANQLDLSGSINGNSENVSNLSVQVNESDNGSEIYNESHNVQITENGTFNFTVDLRSTNESALDSGNYTAYVSYKDETVSDRFSISRSTGGNASTSQTATETPVSTTKKTQTDTVTATQTPNQTSSPTESTNSTSTESSTSS